MLCSTIRDGRTLIPAPYNRRCLVRGKRQLMPSDGLLFGRPTINNSREKRPLHGIYTIIKGPKVRGAFEERSSEASERKRVQIMRLKFSLSQCRDQIFIELGA